MPKLKSKRFPVRKKGPGKGFTDLELAAAAGEKYAVDQVSSEYFEQWIYDQLVESSKMPSGDVLPLETKADAQKIARNMLQQLEWDTKRDLDNQTILDLSGLGDVFGSASPVRGAHGIRVQDAVDEFYKGFHEALQESIPWLAETLLYVNGEIRKGWAHEASEDRRRGYHGNRKYPHFTPGTRVSVIDSDSMYRGWIGTVVQPDVSRTARLDRHNQQLLSQGAILVEGDNGKLFVVPALALTRTTDQSRGSAHEARSVPGAGHGLEWHRYREGFVGTIDGERRFLLDPTADGDWILWHVNRKTGAQDRKIGRFNTAADAKDAARLDKTREPQARLSAPRPTAHVRDYIAVDSRGRKIAGPFKSYGDAKDAAGPGGHTQFVPSARAREVPRGVRRGTRTRA